MSNNSLSTNIVNQTIQVVSADEIRREERNRLVAVLEMKQSESCQKLGCSLDPNRNLWENEGHDFDCDYFYTVSAIALIKGEK